MPPLSPLTTLMPMMRSKQRRFAVVDVPQERNHRRTLDQVGRIIFLLLQVGQHLIFEAHGLLELDIDAQLGRDQLGHIRIHHGGDRGHDAFVHEDPQNFARRHAGRFG